MQFCRQCGIRKQEKGSFCDFCGSPFIGFTAAGIEVNETGGTKPSLNGFSLFWRRKAVAWMGLVFAGLLLVSAIGGYWWVTETEPAKVVQSFTEAMRTQDFAKVQSIVIRPDGGEYSLAEIKVFVAGFREHPRAMDALNKALGVQVKKPVSLKQVDGSLVQVVERKQWITVPRYVVLFQPVTLTFTSNLANTQIQIPGESTSVSTGELNAVISLTMALPHPATIDATVKTAYGDIQQKVDWTLSDWKLHKEQAASVLPIQFDFAQLQLSADLPNVTYKIQGVPVADEQWKQGALLLPTGAQKIEAIHEAPWGEVHAQWSPLLQNGLNTLQIQLENGMMEQLYPKLRDTLLAFIKSREEALKKGSNEGLQSAKEKAKAEVSTEWKEKLDEGYHFTGKLRSIDFYPGQWTMAGDTRIQLLATLHYDSFNWKKDSGEAYYSNAPSEWSYAYDLIYTDQGWQINSFRPIELFVYKEKVNVVLNGEESEKAADVKNDEKNGQIPK